MFCCNVVLWFCRKTDSIDVEVEASGFTKTHLNQLAEACTSFMFAALSYFFSVEDFKTPLVLCVNKNLKILLFSNVPFPDNLV